MGYGAWCSASHLCRGQTCRYLAGAVLVTSAEARLVLGCGPVPVTRAEASPVGTWLVQRATRAEARPVLAAAPVTLAET